MSPATATAAGVLDAEAGHGAEDRGRAPDGPAPRRRATGPGRSRRASPGRRAAASRVVGANPVVRQTCTPAARRSRRTRTGPGDLPDVAAGDDRLVGGGEGGRGPLGRVRARAARRTRPPWTSPSSEHDDLRPRRSARLPGGRSRRRPVRRRRPPPRRRRRARSCRPYRGRPARTARSCGHPAASQRVGRDGRASTSCRGRPVPSPATRPARTSSRRHTSPSRHWA